MTENRLSVPTNPARALRELNRQAPALTRPEAVDVPEDIDKNNTTILQTDKPTDIPTNKQADRLTDQQTIYQTDQPTNQPSNTPTVKPANRPRKAATAAPAEPVLPAPQMQPVPQMARADGRTSRARQDTADKTIVTSMRLAVSTVEALDNYCWQHRMRKQDVVQAALDLYFAVGAAEENE